MHKITDHPETFRRNLQIYYLNKQKGVSYSNIVRSFNISYPRVGQILAKLKKFSHILDEFSLEEIENEITFKTIFERVKNEIIQQEQQAQK